MVLIWFSIIIMNFVHYRFLYHSVAIEIPNVFVSVFFEIQYMNKGDWCSRKRNVNCRKIWFIPRDGVRISSTWCCFLSNNVIIYWYFVYSGFDCISSIAIVPFPIVLIIVPYLNNLFTICSIPVPIIWLLLSTIITQSIRPRIPLTLRLRFRMSWNFSSPCRAVKPFPYITMRIFSLTT